MRPSTTCAAISRRSWVSPTRSSREVNPKIVCAHLSAYGRDGPRKAWPGYDYLMQAEAGYLSLTGEPDGPPARMGLSIVDLMTGLNAAFALVSGVLSARTTGQGRDIDVNLYDTALQNLCYLAVWYLNAGLNQGREPRSAHPSLVPSQLYRTKDGFIFIMCNKEKFWPELCRGDRPARVERARRVQGLQGAPRQPRQTHRGAGRRPVGADHGRVDRGLRRPRAGGAGQRPAVCVGEPVRDATGSRCAPSITRPVPSACSPRRSAAPARSCRAQAAPAMGADTDAILGELGYAAGEIVALRDAGAI